MIQYRLRFYSVFSSLSWLRCVHLNVHQTKSNFTLHLNRKYLSNNSSWDFDTVLDTINPNWLNPDEYFSFISPGRQILGLSKHNFRLWREKLLNGVFSTLLFLLTRLSVHLSVPPLFVRPSQFYFRLNRLGITPWLLGSIFGVNPG